MEPTIEIPEMNYELLLELPLQETEWTCWSCQTVHQIKPRNHNCGGPPVYEKPIIVRQNGMTFPMDIMELFNGGKYCMQCSGCHGCR